MGHFYLLFLVFFVSINLMAQEASNGWVDLEWPSIEGAQAYEIEIYALEGNNRYPRGVFKTEKPNWSSKLDPSLYEFRIHTIDERGLPGEWSPFGKLTVPFDPITLQKPLDKEVFLVTAPLEDISFQWEGTPKASTYFFEIWDSSQNTLYKKETSKTEISVSLKLGRDYFWRVVPMNNSLKSIPKRAPNARSFSLKAGLLTPPSIDLTLKDKKLSFSWNTPARTERFSYQLIFDPEGLNKQIFSKDQIKSNRLLVGTAPLQSGEYRFSLTGLSDQSESSPKAHLSFKWNGQEISDLKKHNENIVASFGEELQKLKQKSTLLFFDFSFGSQNYIGHNYPSSIKPETELTGGRIDIGLYTMKKNWFVNFGVGYEKESYNYENGALSISLFKAELYKRLILFSSLFLEGHLGIGFKETPFIDLDSSRQRLEGQSLSSYGPLFGLKLGKLWGEQFESTISLEIVSPTKKISTPNDGKIESAEYNKLSLDFSYTTDHFFVFRFGVGHTFTQMAFEGYNSQKMKSSNELTIEGVFARLGLGVVF